MITNPIFQIQSEEEHIEELITAPLSSLLLTVDDLPEDYSVSYSGTGDGSQFSSDSNETFTILFSKENISNPNELGFITFELNKFDSIEETETVFSNVIEYMMFIGGFEVIDESINLIGTESKAITNPGHDHIFSFRISNIICVMSSTDYSLTVDLAKIVEQRIYDSLR